MTYKNRVTVADILLLLRQQVLTANAVKNKDELRMLASYFDGLWEIAAKVNDPKMLGLLTDLQYAAYHFAGDVDFKAIEALPSIDAIQELESAAGKYEGSTAKLIQRVVVREELHPVRMGYIGVMSEKIEPDWIGIAFVRGPYRETYDPLCYKWDGRLLSGHEFDTLGQALRYVEATCGIRASEWETCDIDLTGTDGYYVWEFEKK